MPPHSQISGNGVLSIPSPLVWDCPMCHCIPGTKHCGKGKTAPPYEGFPEEEEGRHKPARVFGLHNLCAVSVRVCVYA